MLPSISKSPGWVGMGATILGELNWLRFREKQLHNGIITRDFIKVRVVVLNRKGVLLILLSYDVEFTITSPENVTKNEI